MAGRHRRLPAWRRALLRLRRTDRAARTAALQAEVVALRSVVAELRSRLATAEAAQASAELARAAVEAEHTAAVQAAVERAVAAQPGIRDQRGLRYVTIDLPMVAWTPSVIDLRELPEAALLDPKRDRDSRPLDPAAARAAHKASAGKHARPALRRIA